MKPTILVVDDAPDGIELLRATLKGDYRVKVANSGEEAINLALRSPPDLILLDVLMPGLDGYAVCRRLKAEPALELVPIVFITILGADEDEAQGFAAGGVDYITKPISPPLVLARIATHIDLHHRVRAEREASRLAEESSRVKSDFLAMMSHEVRTPLSVIMASASLLARFPGDPGVTAGEAEKVLVAAQKMRRLIDFLLADDMLTAAGDLPKQPVEIRSLVSEVCAELRETGRSIELQGETARIDAVSGLLRIALANVIGNALNYSPADQPVRVAIHVATDLVRIVVADQGRGIEPEDHDRVFEKFFRALGKGATPGYGLGLFLVRRIAEIHRGEATLVSEPGKGTMVTLLLPRNGQKSLA